MSVPLFANSWYGKLPVDEVRKEIQALYDLVTEAADVDLTAYYTKTEVDSLIAGASMSAAAILAALLTVDGAGSGLDADLLDGLSSSAFSLAGHTHDDRYYTESEVDTLLGGYVPTTRTLTAGTWLSGGGDLSANRTLSLVPGVAAWLVDAVGAERIYLGNAADSSNGFLLRANAANGRFAYRNAANADVFAVSGTGVLTLAAQGTATTAATRQDRTLTAGNGLTGGGSLTANRTFTLGTPGTVTTSSTNAVTSTSHTHAWTQNTTFNSIGSYIFGGLDTKDIDDNSTYSGSSIRGGGVQHIGTLTTAQIGDAYVVKTGGTLSGTWRAMGDVGIATTTTRSRLTLFVRIS